MRPLRADRTHERDRAVAAAADWRRLRRFLVLGTDGSAYRAGSRPAPQRYGDLVARCLRADGPRLVAEILTVRDRCRAARDAPALFALALAAATGDLATRRAAHEALGDVARTSEELFAFVGYAGELDAWGRSLRRALGRWYGARSADALGREAVAGRQPRTGLSHRDVLRIAYPEGRAPIESGEHERLLQWLVRGGPAPAHPPVVEGFERLQAAQRAGSAAALVRAYRLPAQALRAEHLGSAEVWSALLADMPLRELLRSLPQMASAGLLTPGSGAASRVAARLRRLARADHAAGVEPVAVLAALRRYERGPAEPVAEIAEALDAVFHGSLAHAQASGVRLLVALDVSPSMRVGDVAGMPGVSPLEAAAALAMASAASEAHCDIVAFAAESPARRRRRGRADGGVGGLLALEFEAGERLGDVVAALSRLPAGDPDYALPMRVAADRGLDVDLFVVYTDSDGLATETHAAAALAEYRRRSGIDARLVVVGLAAARFAVADPREPGMLDVVGFDPAVPGLIAAFGRGEV